MENRAVSADEKKPESINRKNRSINWGSMAIGIPSVVQTATVTQQKVKPRRGAYPGMMSAGDR
jgi:hypothetical protein